MIRWKKIDGDTSDYFIGSELSQYLQEDTIVLLVNTSKSRTIHLPLFSSLINISAKIIVADATGNAGNKPITITRAGAPDLINGANSVAVNVAYGSVQITGAGSNLWIAAFGFGTFAPTPVAGQLLTFDSGIIPAARVTQMLLDPSQFETLVPDPAPNQIVELVTANIQVIWGGIPYDSGQNGSALVIASSNPLVLPSPFPFPLVIASTPISWLETDFTNFPNGALKMTPLTIPNNISDFSFAITGKGLVLESITDYPITAGNSDIRVYGQYTLKDL